MHLLWAMFGFRQLAVAFAGLGLAVAVVPPMLGSGTQDREAAKSGRAGIEFRVRIDPEKKGQVLCALYRDEDNWLSHTTFRSARTDATKRWAICHFPRVPRGQYAIAALHDEDNDGEMDKNFIGLPTEGYATSRNAHLDTFGKPDWDDALFRHGQRISVEWAAMKY